VLVQLILREAEDAADAALKPQLLQVELLLVLREVRHLLQKIVSKINDWKVSR
jgi:chaperonin GroEL (HSP60 family)